MNHQVEYVARALYDAEYDAREWDRESETLKEEFRYYARAAIACLDQRPVEEAPDLEISEVSHAA